MAYFGKSDIDELEAYCQKIVDEIKANPGALVSAEMQLIMSLAQTNLWLISDKREHLAALESTLDGLLSVRDEISSARAEIKLMERGEG